MWLICGERESEEGVKRDLTERDREKRKKLIEVNDV